MNFFTWLQNSGFPTWVRESESLWALPTILTLHTLGMTVLVGLAIVVNLRLLGIGRQISIASMRGLFRIMWAAFWVNFVTGIMLFAATAEAKGTSIVFWAKLAFVAIGTFTMKRLYTRLYGQPGGIPAVRGIRGLVATSFVAWFAAISAGRLLAYLIRS